MLQCPISFTGYKSRSINHDSVIYCVEYFDVKLALLSDDKCKLKFSEVKEE